MHVPVYVHMELCTDRKKETNGMEKINQMLFSGGRHRTVSYLCFFCYQFFAMSTITIIRKKNASQKIMYSSCSCNNFTWQHNIKILTNLECTVYTMCKLNLGCHKKEEALRNKKDA